jgi:molecular chaperone GrpE
MNKEETHESVENIEEIDAVEEQANDQEDSDGSSEERQLRLEAICQLAKAGELEVSPEMDEIIEALVDSITRRDEIQAKLIRAIADHQNFQRRAGINEREASTSAKQGVVQGLIPLLDQFDMALLQDPEKVSAQQVIDGVRMTRDEFIRILSGYGVTSINPQPGDDFNPGEHEAMMQQPTDEFEAGQVTINMGVGYKLGERVVRPAKVAVASQVEQSDEES